MKVTLKCFIARDCDSIFDRAETPMTLTEFRQSLTATDPPAGITPALGGEIGFR
jgi:hypothetical protein